MTNEPLNNSPNGLPTPETRIEWRRHFNIAMKAGLYIGLAFTLGAISWFFYSRPLIQGLLLLVGFIMAPILMVTQAIRYRDQELLGHISYLRAVSFMTWSYLFGVIISTVVFYTIFSLLFRDPTFMATLEESFALLMSMIESNEIRASYEEVLGSMSPRFIAFNVATTQLFFGLIFMYIAALFVRR